MGLLVVGAANHRRFYKAWKSIAASCSNSPRKVRRRVLKVLLEANEWYAQPKKFPVSSGLAYRLGLPPGDDKSHKTENKRRLAEKISVLVSMAFAALRNLSEAKLEAAAHA